MGTSWITPNESYTSSNGWGFADANAINNNLDYIRNQSAIFNLDKTITGQSGKDTLTLGRFSGYSSVKSTSNLVLDSFDDSKLIIMQNYSLGDVQICPNGGSFFFWNDFFNNNR